MFRRFALAFLLCGAVALASQTPTRFNVPTANTFAAPGEDSLLIDLAGEMVGMIFVAPKTGNLRGATVWYGTITEEDALTGSFQNVDATTGMPDETADQSVTGVAMADGDDNTAEVFTMTTDRAVTKGDVLAFVVEYTSRVDGNLNLVKSDNQSFANNVYVAHKTGGSWAKSSTVPIIAPFYDDGTRAFVYGALPGKTTSESFGDGSTPDERGNVWTPDVPLSVCGCYTRGDMDGDTSCVLYDTNGTTVLESGVIDKDIRGSAAVQAYAIPFDTSVTLSAGSQYRIAMKPTSATTHTITALTVNAAADLDAWVWGQVMHKTTQTDAGGWSQVATVQYGVWPMLCGAGSDTGGGGGVSAARIQGGN